MLNSSRNTRIIDLLDALELRDRIIDEITLPLVTSIPGIVYHTVNQKIKSLVEESKDYLIQNIN